MKIRTLSQNEEAVTFVLNDATIPFVNSIRRLVLDEVLTMAIDTVEIRRNDSALYDEMLAHRLGLVPLTTDLSSYKLRSQCACEGEGCLSCEVKLTLKKTGPCNVYASDLVSSDPKIKPAFDKILIVKLFEGQEIDLVAVACLGKGKEHAKHSSGYMHYRYLPKISVSKDADIEKIKSECRIDIFTNSKIDDDKVLVANLDILAPYFEEGVLKLEESDKDFVITVESYGQLSPKEIIYRASNELQLKLIEFEKKLDL